jgi:hypothetical protein
VAGAVSGAREKTLILSALRRLPPLIVILHAAAAGQVLVDPSRLPGGLRAFETQPNEVSVRCEVSPVRPTLDYGFRFGSGYITRVPLGQYPGGGHRLAMLTRITPEDGGRKPAYFIKRASRRRMAGESPLTS